MTDPQNDNTQDEQALMAEYRAMHFGAEPAVGAPASPSMWNAGLSVSAGPEQPAVEDEEFSAHMRQHLPVG